MPGAGGGGSGGSGAHGLGPPEMLRPMRQSSFITAGIQAAPSRWSQYPGHSALDEFRMCLAHGRWSHPHTTLCIPFGSYKICTVL